MTVIDETKKTGSDQEMMNHWESSHLRGRLVGGIGIVIVGVLFLIREYDENLLPHWLFTWQMLLIAIGITGAIKQGFRHFGWVIPILVGGAFMLRDYAEGFQFKNFIWPVAIIIGGLFIIFKPKSKMCAGRPEWNRSKRQRFAADQENNGTGDDYLEYNAVFGGIKKNIITKNFLGGEVNAVFGGAELNLMQADIASRASLEINAVFGGVKLIIPSHWEVKSEIAAVMGSVEDKRSVHKDIHTDSTKVLVLEGNAVFGGIEIKSF